MRLPALFALAALVGLSACDSAKVSELTGAKPATTQIATSCPPAATPAPVCPPAQPAMPPEAAKPAATAAGTAVAPPAVAHRVKTGATARAWAQRHRAKTVRHFAAAHPHAARPPVRRFAYAGGYTGETMRRHDEAYMERHHERRHARPPAYARPDDAYGRQDYGYERREESYAQDGYRYDRREGGHAPYVDDRRDDGRDAYRYERRDGMYEHGASGSSSSYEHRESGYSSGSISGGAYGDDCNCRPQAAGRDHQGFLTWPGKR